MCYGTVDLPDGFHEAIGVIIHRALVALSLGVRDDRGGRQCWRVWETVVTGDSSEKQPTLA